MKILTRKELKEQLENKFPDATFRTTEEFNGSKGGIWTSGENDDVTWGGFPLFDYYGSGKKYTLGVNNLLHNFLEKRGWYGEWNDPGTMMLWKI